MKLVRAGGLLVPDLNLFRASGLLGSSLAPGTRFVIFMPASTPSAYDEIADMYHKMWADWYLPAALPALDRLLLSHLPEGARVLDVCCGSGHVTRELVRRGFRVTGIDSSARLIDLARQELPGVEFLIEDARSMQLKQQFDAALSTFDSLNHILELDGLRQAFACVRAALLPGSSFVFDMNLEQAYNADLRRWTVTQNPDNVGLVRGSFDHSSKLAKTELIWFLKHGGDCWTHHQSIVEERCYSQSDILLALNEAGFTHVEAVAADEAGMNPDLAYGRLFFAART